MGFLLIPEKQRHILPHTLEELPELQLVRKLEKGEMSSVQSCPTLIILMVLKYTPIHINTHIRAHKHTPPPYSPTHPQGMYKHT